jgi:hypothetical protein
MWSWRNWSYYRGISLGGWGEITRKKNLSQNSLSLRRDLDSGRPEYITGALSTPSRRKERNATTGGENADNEKLYEMKGSGKNERGKQKMNN